MKADSTKHWKNVSGQRPHHALSVCTEGMLVKKSELPVKTCVTCGLPFTWRKKWARCWEQVRYCSERCRRGKSRVRP